MRAKTISEAAEFRRGIEPKASMAVGKNRNNPFTHINSLLFGHFLERSPGVPRTHRHRKILEGVAKLLDVPPEKVRIAVGDAGEPMNYNYREFMEAFDNSVNEDEIEIDDEWWLMKAESGEVYVIEAGEGPVYMLGTIY